eukprot:m.217509 g.217509  ORF g.217509 m.217509 type:complete len:166 (+) comp25690_c0_seq3:4016-4513(+)
MTKIYLTLTACTVWVHMPWCICDCQFRPPSASMGKKKGKAKGPPKSMHGACVNGDIEAMAGFLDEDKAALEEKNKDGWSPLMTCAFRGQLEALEWMIAKGALLDAVCTDKCTAAHYASCQGNVDCLTALSAAGAKLDLTDQDGEAPLDVAEDAKTKAAIKKLLKA